METFTRWVYYFLESDCSCIDSRIGFSDRLDLQERDCAVGA